MLKLINIFAAIILNIVNMNGKLKVLTAGVLFFVGGQFVQAQEKKDEAKEKEIEEVVVVGYGVQKKVNLTGSVATVEGEILEQRPLANATQSLQGMVPGLYIDNANAGRPGATSSLQLRGQGVTCRAMLLLMYWSME